MTTAQLDAAQTLIPAAFDRNAPLHRAVVTQEVVVPATVVRQTYDDAFAATRPSPRPATRLAKATGILGDLGLAVAVVFAVALAPIMAGHVIVAAAKLVWRALAAAAALF